MDSQRPPVNYWSTNKKKILLCSLPIWRAHNGFSCLTQDFVEATKGEQRDKHPATEISTEGKSYNGSHQRKSSCWV
jgi:hypothetical protein